MSSTHRAGIYVRISQDRDGRALGVARQEQDCRALCRARGWSVAEVYSDNDVSASSGRRRPEYERLLADIERRRVDAVAVWALDRLHRRPVELERFIDLADRHGVALGSVGGDVDLSTSGGRLHARMMGAVARHEVEHKSDRTKRAQQQAVEAGRWLGGTRPFGWNVNGARPTLHRAEARQVRRLSEAVLVGASLGGLIRDLNDRGIPTTTGRPWTYATLRQMLVRPRNAGHVEYHGEIVARDSWPPLVDEDTWLAVRSLLSDPNRRRSTSNRLRWMGSGLYLCGICGGPVKSASVTSNRRTGTTRTVYRCHVARAADPVDELVSEIVVARLARPDGGKLLAANDAPDTAELRGRAMALRERIDGLSTAYADGLVTLPALRRETERLRAELSAVEAQQVTVPRAAVLADLVRARDVQGVWGALALDRRRAVVDALMAVTILPSGRRGNGFDPRLVQIAWKTT